MTETVIAMPLLYVAVAAWHQRVSVSIYQHIDALTRFMLFSGAKKPLETVLSNISALI